MRMTIATTFIRMMISWQLQKIVNTNVKGNANSADCILALVRPFKYWRGHSKSTQGLKRGGEGVIKMRKKAYDSVQGVGGLHNECMHAYVILTP